MSRNLDFATPIPANLPTTESYKPTGADFAQMFDYEFDHRNSQLKGGGLSDMMRHDRVMELHVLMHQTGWEKATVINMNPFELRMGMGNIGEMRIPARKEGEPYTKFVISKYRISMRDLGDAKFIPEAVLPVTLAKDIVREFKDYGGVIWYRGDGEPNPEEIKEARESQMAFYQLQYRKALDTWNRSNKQLGFITSHMMNASRELYKTGQIERLPEWCTVTRKEAERTCCPSCGEDIKTSAKKCRFCGYFLDSEFAKENKERYGTGITALQASDQPLIDPIDNSKKIVDQFMAEDDPDALNQSKNLDEHLLKDKHKVDEIEEGKKERNNFRKPVSRL